MKLLNSLTAFSLIATYLSFINASLDNKPTYITVSKTVYITQIRYSTVYRCTTMNSIPIQTSSSIYSPTTSSTSSNSRPSETSHGKDLDARTIEMICRVNKIRREKGKPELKIDERLMKAAQLHSQDQAEHKQMTHTGTKIASFFDRIKASGFKPYTGAENVAYNQKDIEQVVEAWKNSPGHYQNMIGDFECFGWGEEKLYWSQLLASGSACSNPVTPNCQGY